jgi:adenylate cyclase
VLAEFVSVVDATDCAVQIQQAITAAMADERPQRRILFRIGINVGNVMVKDDDIFGDGVNIAARLEALAESGGICVFARRSRPSPQQGLLDVRRFGRAERQEHRPTHTGLSGAVLRRAAHRNRAGSTSSQYADGPFAKLAEAHRHALLEGTTQPGLSTSPAELVAVELAFWESVRESYNPAMYEAYLEKYGEGAFAALVKARLDELRP